MIITCNNADLLVIMLYFSCTELLPYDALSYDMLNSLLLET